MKASPRRASKAAAEALERRRKESAYFRNNWRIWRSQEVTAALGGPHKIAFRNLLDACRAARVWQDLDPVALMEPFVDTDRHTTDVAIGIVNSFVRAMRETAGLPPFDDAIPF